jgi:hypothetical protein
VEWCVRERINVETVRYSISVVGVALDDITARRLWHSVWSVRSPRGMHEVVVRL